MNTDSRPTRVLMAVPHYPYPVLGGLERQSHELAKALTALGLEVQALSGVNSPDQTGKETVEGIVVHRIPWPERKLLRFVRTPFDVLAVLRAQSRSYDVIHLHQFSWFGAFVIVAARLLGKPVLVKLSSVGSHSLPGMVGSSFGRTKLAIFKLADAVVAMSAESVGELKAVDFPMGRVLRTPNGIRLIPGAVRPDAAALCRVVFVGRLSSEKRIDDLLHAWQGVVRQASVPAVLELWGNGPAEDEMKALCTELGIGGSVEFRGHVEDVRDRLGEMDVFVLTSAREGNSNAILEAMAAGLPVVSTRVGGTPMLVGPEGAALLVNPGDREGLYSRLLSLVDDANARRTVGGRMRARIEKHFDMTRVACTYAAAYRLLASRRRDELDGVSNPVINGA
ncbi:MAG: glycosyltransferase family 4 protein [Gammaproteobacteria bacterium]